MGAQQAPSRLPGFRRCAATVGLTVAGCALILASLHQVPKPPKPAAVTPTYRADASSRGRQAGARTWFSPEARGAALATGELTPTQEIPLITSTVEGPALPTPQETVTATATLTPTVEP